MNTILSDLSRFISISQTLLETHTVSTLNQIILYCIAIYVGFLLAKATFLYLLHSFFYGCGRLVTTILRALCCKRYTSSACTICAVATGKPRMLSCCRSVIHKECLTRHIVSTHRMTCPSCKNHEDPFLVQTVLRVVLERSHQQY